MNSGPVSLFLIEEAGNEVCVVLQITKRFYPTWYYTLYIKHAEWPANQAVRDEYLRNIAQIIRAYIKKEPEHCLEMLERVRTVGDLKKLIT